MDGGHLAKPPFAPRALLLPGPALRAIVAGVADDHHGYVRPLDCGGRGPSPRAGTADLPDGPAPSGRSDPAHWASPCPGRADTRLTEADLPALRSALSTAGIALKLGPTEASELLRISHRYGVYLHIMSRWLMITLPPWIPPADDKPAGVGLEYTQALNPIAPREPKTAD